MSEIFNDKTTAEIDAKLHRDILKHNLNIEKISIGLVILLMILFRGWIFYWLKFGVAVLLLVQLCQSLLLGGLCSRSAGSLFLGCRLLFRCGF